MTTPSGPVELRNWLGAEQVLTYPQPSVKLTNGVATWLHFDHLGSVRAITDATGVKVEAAIYRPFGEQSEWLLPGNVSPETKGWIGERYDADAGLQYLNARYYDPALGMFLQPDWFEILAAGTNRFSYCSGDPVNCSDANGNVPDNWATEDDQTAYDSNGFVSTYQGEGMLDTVEYASWNDHQNADYDTYMDHPGSYSPFAEGGDIGVVTQHTSYHGGAYGKDAHVSYGSLETISVAEYLDPPIQSPFIELDIALAAVGAWEFSAAKNVTTMYRAVGPVEYVDIFRTGSFQMGPGYALGKPFGLKLDETLQFTDFAKDAVGIVGVDVPTKVLNKIADFTPMDTMIFKSGTLTIPTESLPTFNKSIMRIWDAMQ